MLALCVIPTPSLEHLLHTHLYIYVYICRIWWLLWFFFFYSIYYMVFKNGSWIIDRSGVWLWKIISCRTVPQDTSGSWALHSPAQTARGWSNVTPRRSNVQRLMLGAIGVSFLYPLEIKLFRWWRVRDVELIPSGYAAGSVTSINLVRRDSMATKWGSWAWAQTFRGSPESPCKLELTPPMGFPEHFGVLAQLDDWPMRCTARI